MDLHADAKVFRLLMESARKYAVSLLDVEGRVVFWNAAAERMLGWSRDDVLGRHVEELYSPEEVALGTPRRSLDEARSQGVSQEEGWRLRPDGERFWAVVTTEALREDGLVIGFGQLLRDETVSKREADKLRFLADSGAVLAESLDLTESCTRVAALAVPEIADWVVVDVCRSGTLERLALAHVDPELERIGRQLARRHPPTRDREGSVFEVIDSGRPKLIAHVPDERLVEVAQDREQLEHLRALGVRSWMCVPLSAHGNVLGAITFAMGQSGRVFTEADVAFAVEVGKRAGLTLDNARLYDDARRALRAREDFLAVASHELRTPLTPLRLQLDALSRSFCQDDGGAPQREHRKIEVMRRQVDRLARLVESLLAVTRGAPIELPTRECADLAEIVRDVVERMQERAYHAGTEMRFEPRGTVRGRFDARALEIVVEHIIDNALKYGDGAPVEILVERTGDTGVIRVSDRGIGIEEADQERIFEKFERSVSADHYGGLGLGLFIARELVEGHGGGLRVRSERGRGAAFIIELPLDERPREALEQQPGGAP